MIARMFVRVRVCVSLLMPIFEIFYFVFWVELLVTREWYRHTYLNTQSQMHISYPTTLSFTTSYPHWRGHARLQGLDSLILSGREVCARPLIIFSEEV